MILERRVEFNYYCGEQILNKLVLFVVNDKKRTIFVHNLECSTLAFRSPIPFKNPLYIVVGRPIELEKNPEPTMEQVNT